MLTAGITTDTSRFDRMVGSLSAATSAPMRTPAMRAGVEEAAQAYAAAMQTRFNLASGGDGTWAPLARSTVRKKSRKTLFPDRVLYLTGALFASLTPGGTGSIYEVMDDRVRYGTRNRVAHFHQFGTTRMPARPILAEATRDTLARCTAAITEGWRKVIQNACTNN